MFYKQVKALLFIVLCSPGVALATFQTASPLTEANLLATQFSQEVGGIAITDEYRQIVLSHVRAALRVNPIGDDPQCFLHGPRSGGSSRDARPRQSGERSGTVHRLRQDIDWQSGP